MNYTKGPWEYSRMRLGVKEKDRRCGFVVNGPDKGGLELPTRICDLRVPSGIDGFVEGEGNTRLISSAPEMYEALSFSILHLRAGKAMCQEGSETAKRFDIAINKALTALAKAEGRG